MTYLDCGATPFTRGITLVEASAGTGKTYAIAMLVLRAVCEESIPIDKILVVTFTCAATEELRSRIRRRLVEARELLSGAENGGEDATMETWLAGVEEPGLYAERIRLALLDIDRAEILTIHSFCQRMLREQALECGQLFDIELQGDIDQIRQQVVEDFWRHHLYGMEAQPCGAIIAGYTTPDELYQSVKAAGAEYGRIEPRDVRIQAMASIYVEAYGDLRTWFVQHGRRTMEALVTARAANQFKKPFSDEGAIEGAWQKIGDFLEGRLFAPTDELNYLAEEGILTTIAQKAIKKDHDRKAFMAALALPDGAARTFLSAWKNLLIAFRRELLSDLEERLEHRLMALGLMSFDDLIRRLDLALQRDTGQLQRLLSARYQAAFIDEFQDTDGGQWAIFSKIFGDNHFLFLIGDPKQAIYKFRGADIYSYFAARTAAARQLTLQRNHRSHPGLVAAVNHLFSIRRAPFVYPEEKLPFSPAEPGKTAEDGALYRNGEPLEVMVYWQLAVKEGKKSWTSGAAGERLCQETVTEILSLLDRNDSVSFVRRGGSRPLQPRDIAILVRSHRQADLYRAACAKVGLPAVVASRNSVYDTEEAKEMLRLLRSLAEPGNVLLLKSAMTVSWFGLSGNELARIWGDETAFDQWLSRFSLYHRLWQEKGFMVMMQGLLEAEEVLHTLSTTLLGERRIANIRHLLELIQRTESEEKLGPTQSILRLEATIDEQGGGEEAELRLESDEEAVRIITMHSAKGLQYPVVFCPYLWYRSGRLKREKEIIRCHEDGELLVDLGSSLFERRKEIALEEELAEELRLLYVAVTRAEVRCYVMMASCQGGSWNLDSRESALGYLLFDRQALSQAEQEEVLRRFAAESRAAYRLIPAEEQVDAARYGGRGDVCIRLASRTRGERPLYTDYQMSSYSAMAALSEQDDHGSDLDEERNVDGSSILHPGLPAGPGFGNLIHDSFESVPFSRFRDAGAIETVGVICRRYGIDTEQEGICRFLADATETMLPAGYAGDSFSLAQLDEACCVKEMPFYFHIARIRTGEINQILAAEPTVTDLAPRSLQGYLTGFVDLFCEHGGRYYIMDYKTNYLGEQLADYQGDRLVRAMAAHNYGLQYWIYTLVLHRYLRNMVEGYDYRRHFGGVLYLFVRGMAPDVFGSGVYYDLPDGDLLARLDTAFGGLHGR